MVVDVAGGPGSGRVQAAQRAGLPDTILNPGVPVDRLYRDLGVPICVFEGTWARHQAWDGAGSRPGDGHLVSGVPAADRDRAERLLAARGATFGLVSTGAGDVVGAGSAGRSTTIGS